MTSANSPNIYVFDFDQTITHIHTSGCAVTREEVGEEYIRSNIKDGFVELVEYLTQRDARIYIATYGDDSFGRGIQGATAGHALVQRYMDVVFGADQQYFSTEPAGNIIARCTNDGKHYHLERILEREELDGRNPDAMRCILLVDDDPYNVHYFANRGCATLVPDSPYESARMAAAAGILRALLDGLKGESENPTD
jgi:phosphoserine phosphatase